MFNVKWIVPALAGCLMAAVAAWGQEAAGVVVLSGQRVSGGGAGAGVAAPVLAATRLSMIKAAYLGLSVAPAPEVLRAQLKLDQGAGLVVEYVEPGSPAEQAGIKQFDVLLKLDDQILINPPQLETLIRLHKPEQSVTVQLIHEGKAATVTARLIEKAMPAMGNEENPGPVRSRIRSFGAGGGDGSAPYWAPREPGVWVRPEQRSVYTDGQYLLLMENNNGQPQLRATDVQSGKVLFVGPTATEQDLQAMPKEVLVRFRAATEGGLLGPGNGPGNAVKFQSFTANSNAGQMFYSDGQYWLTKTTEDGQDHLHAVDMHSGDVIFDGPITTDEQKKALPPETAQRLKAMMQPATTRPMPQLMPMPPPESD